MPRVSLKNSDSGTNPRFRFFCINTTLNDYRLCWALNETLNLKLTRIENISINEMAMQTFSIFQDKESNPPVTISLLSLKSEKGLLLKDLAGFDFVFCIDGNIEIADLQLKISTIKNVLLITRLENKKTKPSTITELTYLIEMIG